MDAAGRVWFRDALHGELARTTVANPFDERGGPCMAAFRNQVHTGSPSEDLCSRVSIQSFAMSGSGAMSTRAIAQFFTASEVSNAHEARRRSSGECGALSLSLSLSLS